MARDLLRSEQNGQIQDCDRPAGSDEFRKGHRYENVVEQWCHSGRAQFGFEHDAGCAGKALEAKHVPAHAQRASRLPFTYVILGENNSQASGGGFSEKPAGNWTAMKIFIGDGEDESEVFLNFNSVSRKAQFSEKDVDYGDTVVAKLATVL